MKIENHFENRLGSKGRKGFTLVEILIVLVIISILMALLFPAFKGAQERSAQSSCASNLHNIYMAVQQYKLDERSYPGSLAVLLPGGDSNDEVLANTAITSKVNGVNCTVPTPAAGPTPAASPTPPADGSGTCPNVRGTGYLKSSDNLVCPNDDRDNILISSYGDISTGFFKSSPTPSPTPDAIYQAGGEENVLPTSAEKDAFLSRYVWNYWGYNQNGVAYLRAQDAEAEAETPVDSTTVPNPTYPKLANPTRLNGYDARRNPINLSLSNRYAPANTIITRCIFHRVQTANALNRPTDLYANAADSAGARDIVLRLDGSAKPLDVASWNVVTNSMTQWQRQELK